MNCSNCKHIIHGKHTLCRKCSMINSVNILKDKYEQPVHIIDNIYLGSRAATVDADKLVEQNIRYILVAGKMIINIYPNVIYYILPIEDSTKQNILSYISDAMTFIKQSQNEDSNILIHCMAGKSRSASFVIAYLIKYYGYTYHKAYKYVKSIRSVCRPNVYFVKQLKEYEKKCQFLIEKNDRNRTSKTSSKTKSTTDGTA